LLPTNFVDAPGGTRIPNLLIRSQMLYPIELRALTERRRIDLDEDDRMQTRIIDRAHAPVNPIHVRGHWKKKASGTEPEATIWAVQDSNL
jgi:hypothetical protein